MKAKNITLGGILIALGVVILYLTTIIPINTLALLTLSSCLIPIAIVRGNLKTAFFVYIGTSALSFFLLPINYALMYIFLFGIYGIVKFFIEKLNKIPLEILFKLIYFNILLMLGLFFINNFLSYFNINMNIYLFIIFANVVFLIYDYALTIFLTYFLEKINKRLK